jgi:hypothetical protein
MGAGVVASSKGVTNENPTAAPLRRCEKITAVGPTGLFAPSHSSWFQICLNYHEGHERHEGADPVRL